jgi:acetyl esterase/lipase
MPVLLLGLALLGAMQSGRSTVVYENNLVFTPDGAPVLRLDLARLSQGSGPFPAVVCLHGGGWVGGDRKQMSQTLEVLARRGYVAIAPDYRLAPAHTFPAPLEDCKLAIRWLRTHAGRYQIDPDRVAVVGLAAGGHLACLVGVTSANDGLEGGGSADRSSRVQAVVSFFGPTDLTDPDWGKEAREKNITPLLGGTLSEKPDLYRRASPALHDCKGAPPFLFLHGAADTTVPVKQAEALVEKLRQADCSARLVALEGEGHGFRGEQLLRAIDLMLTFLDEKLKK